MKISSGRNQMNEIWGGDCIIVVQTWCLWKWELCLMFFTAWSVCRTQLLMAHAFKCWRLPGMHGLLTVFWGALELLIKLKSVFGRVVPFSRFTGLPLIIENLIFYWFQNTEMMLFHDCDEKMNLFESYIIILGNSLECEVVSSLFTSSHLLRFFKMRCELQLSVTH